MIFAKPLYEHIKTIFNNGNYQDTLEGKRE